MSDFFSPGLGPVWTSCVDIPANSAGITVNILTGDWAEFTDGAITGYRLEVSHNLNSRNLIFRGENTEKTAWIEKNYEYISDNTFYLKVRNLADIYTGQLHIITTDALKAAATIPGGEVDGFVETFGIIKWIQIGATDNYRATFTHGLNTDLVEFNAFVDNNCPYLLCAETKTTNTLTFVVPSRARRGGTIFIERVV